ncbi:TLD-domain-containing protein [Durotheca rogersii]|uniref:TLD-domain-containing protein n=1 Tax=Durotheca rogersii TaxID=419775 RepID=UPI00221F61F9|nr:TLD-domain-containing protein [Durotheca rogersii]KAI5859687.1 TLD-domain-containing protein [Durotheca rogersii]
MPRRAGAAGSASGRPLPRGSRTKTNPTQQLTAVCNRHPSSTNLIIPSRLHRLRRRPPPGWLHLLQRTIMGQSLSDEAKPPSKEEITADLAEKFARRCFTPLELYSLKDNFKSLADHEQDVRFLREETIARFLELPDILAASPVVFHMLTFVGAFPFLRDAPVILGFEQMIMVVVIMTERYAKILAKGASSRRKLLFKSLAVYDRKLSEIGEEHGAAGTPETNAGRHAPGFAVDEAGDEFDDGAADDDELVLAALDSLDIYDAFKLCDSHAATTRGAMIPADNLRKLIMLLLLVSPLDAQESLSRYADRVTGSELEDLRATAENILSAFIDVEKSPGISYSQFDRVLPSNLPFLFDGFNPLFEHFLFSKNLDLSKRKDGASIAVAPPTVAQPSPLLQQPGQILNVNVLSQLSFFIRGDELFRRLRLLYAGSEAGFSMGSFEAKVFNWRAPTILLVSGTRLSNSSGSGGSEGAFSDSLPPKRFPDGSAPGRDRLVFGAIVRQPWRQTYKECFGGEDMLLFQLGPTHDVFPASALNRNYAAFVKPPTMNPGIAFGCPHPRANQSRRESLRHLGPVSLVIDSSFEFGVFTHDFVSRGGAFTTSPHRKYNFQDRFQVDEIEVWGCGGDEEARMQRERWEWETREAEARRRINLGTGDIATDRALLEMAGLIGANRSGGSMMS